MHITELPAHALLQAIQAREVSCREVMAAILQAEKQVDVVYAHNDDMALGAIEALEATGRKPGKDVLVIGVDATRGAFEAMVQNKLNVTVECNPLNGPQLMDLVKLVKAGNPVPKRVQSREDVFAMDKAASLIGSPWNSPMLGPPPRSGASSCWRVAHPPLRST